MNGGTHSTDNPAYPRPDLRGWTVVTVTEGRWDVQIDLVSPTGDMVCMVASADRFYTEADHIWWSSKQEWVDYDG